MCFFSVFALYVLIFAACNRSTEILSYVVIPAELRPQVREYVLEKTHAGLEKMILSARNNESVPTEMSFLINIAKNLYGSQIPARMDSRAVLDAFESRQEAFEVIEEYYRDEIFRLFCRNMNEAVRLFNQNNIVSHSVENTFERSKLSFHIVDQEATEIFNNYYRSNPLTTFDEMGTLVNPSIVPPDVIIIGVFNKDAYGLLGQHRNPDGSLRFVAIKREVGLDGNHIQYASIEQGHIDGRPEIVFTLDNEGGNIFYRLTSANILRPMAVVLDNKIRSQATILAPIKDTVRITGFDTAEALLLAEMFGADTSRFRNTQRNTPQLRERNRVICEVEAIARKLSREKTRGWWRLLEE